jgi:cobalamin biosynthesis protein CobW
VIALADAEAVADGRFAPNPAAVEAQRLADDSLDHETPLSEVFEDQIACADIVLLTKPDLAGPEGLAKARAVIAAEAPRPLPVIEVGEGIVDPRVILGLGAAAEADLANRPSHHDGEDEHDHEDFDSVVIDLPELHSPDEIAARIEALARDRGILRVKGYAAVQGKPMRLLVQAVGARVRWQYDRPWGPGEARAGRLVVIAEHDAIDRAAIEAALVAEAA